MLGLAESTARSDVTGTGTVVVKTPERSLAQATSPGLRRLQSVSGARDYRHGSGRTDAPHDRSDTHMEYRYLGNSGLKVSEITYGNWLTHASQVENDAAIACVKAALEVGISTFDTADVYANTGAETVLGEALKGERRQSLEIATKVFGPTGPKGHNDTGLSRKHILESIDGSLQRLQTDYVDLYQAHRYDHETPLEETMQAFADIVRQGKVLYVGVSEWTADQLRAGAALAKDLGFQLISNQPQYSALWRVIEDEVVPTSKELGVSQIVWSPIAQGVLTGKYKPGQPLPEGSRATDDKGGADMIKRFMRDEVLSSVQELQPVADELNLSMAQLAVAWVLQNENVASAIIGASRPEQVHDNAGAAGVTIPAELMSRIDDALGAVVERDPAKTNDSSPKTREA
jgi:aryl-alcohol dehydrogenase-like predicted oxidoreductase